uniref:DUF8033 domain-containing protein n=1 Tax=viral metagenome TaxID=1070528 RepID=A0A6H2A5Y9_9ZZZZ
MAQIYLRKGTGRNTQAYRLSLNGHKLYFSYETCIGYDGPLGRFRLQNVWGPTTGRHINEMHLKDWPVVGKEAMEEALKSI